MKELFPAEWFPINITVIFFLGARSDIPTVSAMYTKPEMPILAKNYSSFSMIEGMLYIYHLPIQGRKLVCKFCKFLFKKHHDKSWKDIKVYYESDVKMSSKIRMERSIEKYNVTESNPTSLWRYFVDIQFMAFLQYFFVYTYTTTFWGICRWTGFSVACRHFRRRMRAIMLAE